MRLQQEQPRENNEQSNNPDTQQINNAIQKRQERLKQTTDNQEQQKLHNEIKELETAQDIITKTLVILQSDKFDKSTKKTFITEIKDALGYINKKYTIDFSAPIKTYYNNADQNNNADQKPKTNSQTKITNIQSQDDYDENYYKTIRTPDGSIAGRITVSTRFMDQNEQKAFSREIHGAEYFRQQDLDALTREARDTLAALGLTIHGTWISEHQTNLIINGVYKEEKIKMLGSILTRLALVGASTGYKDLNTNERVSIDIKQGLRNLIKQFNKDANAFIEAKKDEIKKKQQELRTLQENVKKKTDDYTKVQQDITNTPITDRQKRLNLNNQIKSLSNSITIENGKIKEMQTKLTNAEMDLTILQKTIDRVKNDLQALQSIQKLNDKQTIQKTQEKNADPLTESHEITTTIYNKLQELEKKVNKQ